jgi:hypothetical protein
MPLRQQLQHKRVDAVLAAAHTNFVVAFGERPRNAQADEKHERKKCIHSIEAPVSVLKTNQQPHHVNMNASKAGNKQIHECASAQPEHSFVGLPEWGRQLAGTNRCRGPVASTNGAPDHGASSQQ